MNATTEFLSKSLVTAGVFLAIPAAASVVIIVLGLAIMAPHFRLDALAPPLAACRAFGLSRADGF